MSRAALPVARHDERPAPRSSAPSRASAGLRPPGYGVGLADTYRGALQLKPRVGRVDDPLEREADRAADIVMGGAARFPPCLCQDAPKGTPQRVPDPMQSAGEEDALGDLIDAEFGIQAKAAPGGRLAREAPIDLPGSGGFPLPAHQRAFLEPRFGRDLGAVRVHDGPRADAAARALGARAYAQGGNVVFRAGEYAASAPSGSWLLAHELAHVAQQGHAPPLGPGALPLGAATPGAPQHFDELNSLTATERPITEAEARRLNPDQLDNAIYAVQYFLDQHIQSSDATEIALANLGILERVRDDDVPFDEREFDTEAEDWSPGHKLPAITRGEPTNLRSSPSATGSLIAALPMNVKLVVESESGSWRRVVTEDGRRGWISAPLVETKLPEPDAKLHLVKKGETAQGIARQYYSAHAKEWGQDERFFVNVLYYVNSHHPAQGADQGIVRPAGSEEDWDQTIVKADHRIWIPSVDFALGLKAVVPSGSITHDAWQTLKDVFIGTGGFIAGLLYGAGESIVDLFVGIWDLIKLVYDVVKSLVTGEIISDIRKLWNDVSGLDIGALVTAGVEHVDKLWNAPSTWDRWFFRGRVIGYAVVEILMLIFSGGIATAVKWAGKIGKLGTLIAKFPTLLKLAEKAKALTGPAADAVRLAAKGLSKAHAWAQSMLRIPFEIIKDTAASALERLQKLSSYAQEKFRHLNPFAMKQLLGCASPCKVDIHKIEEYFKALAPVAGKVAKKLATIEDIIAALPSGKFNMQMIRKKLKSRPALRKLIESAELTADDFAKIGDFATAADLANPASAYRTFVRYVTSVVPVKSQGDVGKFNKIAAEIVAADARQGAALKGSMFEGFVKLNVPELGGRNFLRVTFEKSKSLPLLKSRRTVDNFVEASGEIWEIKHTIAKVPPDQVTDYGRLIGRMTSGGKEVKSINYLFATKAGAEANLHLKTAGFSVRYLDPVTKAMVPL